MSKRIEESMIAHLINRFGSYNKNAQEEYGKQFKAGVKLGLDLAREVANNLESDDEFPAGTVVEALNKIEEEG